MGRSKEEIKKLLINEIKLETTKGHFPTVRELQNKFGIRLYNFKQNIKELYVEAGIAYKLNINQQLKYEKAKKFTEVIIEILPRLDFELIRYNEVNKQGVDILVKNKIGETIGLELKAYNKYEPIKVYHINQAIRFIEKENLKKVIIITTSSKVQNNVKIPNNIELLMFESIKELCDQKLLEKLNFIRETSVNFEPKYREIKRKEIVEYIQQEVKQGKEPRLIDIDKSLKLNTLTYFSSLKEVYKKAELEVPRRLINGFVRSKKPDIEEMNYYINKILTYIKDEIEKGKYPTENDLLKKFNLTSNIRNTIGMNELYNRLGVPPYNKRKSRKKSHLL